MATEIHYETSPRSGADVDLLQIQGPTGEGWKGPQVSLLGGLIFFFWDREVPDKPAKAKKKA